MRLTKFECFQNTLNKADEQGIVGTVNMPETDPKLKMSVSHIQIEMQCQQP